MKPRLWKIILFFVFAFGGMVVPVVVCLLLGFLGPPPYLLDEDRLGPEWSKVKTYPDGSTVVVHTYPNAAAAKGGVGALARDIPSSSTSQVGDVLWYTRKDNQRRGLLLPVDNRLIHIEAGDDQALDERLKSLPFVRENPKKNLMWVLFTEHLGAFFLGVAVYFAAWLVLLYRGGSWAATIPPLPGVTPVPAETLRARLLAVNGLNLPFQVREEPNGRLVAEWRIVDANWVGVLHAGGLQRAHQVQMALDPGAHKVRVQDRDRAIKWRGDVARVGWSWSFYWGINFFHYERGVQVGLFFKDGQWTTTAYNYRFNLAEMKNPLIEVIVGSGWTFAPVVTFFRPIGG